MSTAVITDKAASLPLVFCYQYQQKQTVCSAVQVQGGEVATTIVLLC